MLSLGHLRNKSLVLLLVALAVVALGVTSVSAQSFELRFGNRFLGTLVYEDDSGETRVAANLSNTPLSLFNGTFEAATRSIHATSGNSLGEYRSLGRSSRNTREIAVVFDRDTVVETRINPLSERTDLSNPINVTDSVIDPVSALGEILSASECPSDLRIYDGRRVILLSSLRSQRVDDILSCELRYSVIAGPGHLSPLYIREISLKLSYVISADTQLLSRMQMSAGLWSLNIIRQD
tara:strand:- start:738 stop:1448 length:711 start_codon:yes stop_codon:yes gene_type:complete